MFREQTLHNLRKLLKPGGHLIVSEGSYNDEGVDTRPTITFGTWPWWCTGADHRQTPLPYLSNGQWDELLRRTGFSGIDVASPKESTNVLGATVFVSQAIDEQVAFLRDPVGVPYGRTIIQKLVIVGGLTSRSAHLAEGLQRILSTSVSTTYHFGALEDVDYSIVDQKSTVISLTELDKPVFQDMTPTRFLAFKQMFETGKTLLWITSGRLEDQPYSNLTLGFGRTALVETPNLRLQQLDLAEPQATHALLIAEMILRLASGDSDTVLWPVEPEIVLDIAGNKLVPRLKPIRAFNDRYNSSTRKIETLVNLEETPVTLEMTETSYVAKKSTASHSLSRQSEDLLDLRTVYTTSRAIKTTCGHHYLVLCQDSHTQDNYLVLAPSLMSNYRLPKLHVVPCTADSCDTAFFNLLAARLISTALFDSVYPGQTIVVHNATEPLATAFRAQASMRGFDLFFTADSTNTIAAEANLTFVPYLTKYEISQILPKQISCFVGLSASDAQSCDNEMAIESALPQQCRRERASTIFAGQGLSTAAPSPAVLHSALQSLTEDDLLESQRKSQPRAAVDVRSILEGPFPANELTTIDWTTCTSLPIMIARLDAQQLLANNKTYWIIGLSTALAASLFDWMIERGAKYLVFTSRRPQLDQDWIEFWTRKGVTIETVAW